MSQLTCTVSDFLSSTIMTSYVHESVHEKHNWITYLVHGSEIYEVAPKVLPMYSSYVLKIRPILRHNRSLEFQMYPEISKSQDNWVTMGLVSLLSPALKIILNIIN